MEGRDRWKLWQPSHSSTTPSHSVHSLLPQPKISPLRASMGLFVWPLKAFPGSKEATAALAVLAGSAVGDQAKPAGSRQGPFEHGCYSPEGWKDSALYMESSNFDMAQVLLKDCVLDFINPRQTERPSRHLGADTASGSRPHHGGRFLDATTVACLGSRAEDLVSGDRHFQCGQIQDNAH